MTSSHPIHSRVPREAIYWDTDTWLPRRIFLALLLPMEEHTRSLSSIKKWQAEASSFPRVLPSLTCGVMGHIPTVHRHHWGMKVGETLGTDVFPLSMWWFLCPAIWLDPLTQRQKCSPSSFFTPDRHLLDDEAPTFRPKRCYPTTNWKAGPGGIKATHALLNEAVARRSSWIADWSPRSSRGMQEVAYWSHLRRTRFVLLASTKNNLQVGRQHRQAMFVTSLHHQLHHRQPRRALLIWVTQGGGFRKDKFSCLPKAQRKMGGGKTTSQIKKIK